MRERKMTDLIYITYIYIWNDSLPFNLINDTYYISLYNKKKKTRRMNMKATDDNNDSGDTDCDRSSITSPSLTTAYLKDVKSVNVR